MKNFNCAGEEKDIEAPEKSQEFSNREIEKESSLTEDDFNKSSKD